jgi:hypothetical protein
VSEDQAARNIVDEAFGILVAEVVPVLDDVLRDHLGPDWRVRLGLESPTGISLGRDPLADHARVLGIILDPLCEPAMRARVGDRYRDLIRWAAQLRAVRNDHAHREPVDALTALRTVEGVRALGQTVGASGSGERLEALRVSAVALLGAPSEEAIESLRARYLETVDVQTATVPLAGLGRAAPPALQRVPLESVFVAPGVSEWSPGARSTTSGGEGPEIVDHEDGEDAFLAEIIAKKRVVLVGEPGSGKSTVLRWVARRLAFPSPVASAARSHVVPILLTAARYAQALAEDEALSVRRHLVTDVRQRSGSFLAMALDRGEAALLVDAIDEIADTAMRATVLRRLAEFVADHPDCLVVATSRVVGLHLGPLGPGFGAWRIRPLSGPRRAEFVRAWAGALGFATDIGLLDFEESLESMEGGRALLGNPLLLLITFLLWERGSRLPSRRTDLYQLLTDTLVREWPLQRAGPSWDGRRAIERLAPLAWELLLRGDDLEAEPVLSSLAGAIAEDEGLSQAAAREEARRFLAIVEQRTGFFVESGNTGAPRYGFLHRSFAEYLAGVHLAERWRSGLLEIDALADRAEHGEVLRFTAGVLSAGSRADAARFLAELLEREPTGRRAVAFRLGLVLALLADGVEVTNAMRDMIIADAVELIVRTPLAELASDLGGLLAKVSMVQPLGSMTLRAEPVPGEDAPTRARKAVLLVRLDPDDDARLRDALLRWDLIAAEESIYDLYPLGLLRAAGASHWLVDGPTQSPWLLAFRGRVLTVGEEDGERLADLGFPAVPLADVWADPELLDTADRGVLLDLRDRAEPTVAQYVSVAARSTAVRWDRILSPGPDWHDGNRSPIADLARDPAALPPVVVAIARDEELLGEEGSEAWSDVLDAIAREGSPEARIDALDAIVGAVEDDDPDRGDIDLLRAAARDVEPLLRRWAAGRLPLHRPELEDEVRRLAAEDGDETVRGAAMRHLIAEAAVPPLSFVADPAFAGAFGPGVREPWGKLLAALSPLALGEGEEATVAWRTMRDLLRRVADPSELDERLQDMPANVMTQLAEEASGDDSREARAAAAVLRMAPPRSVPLGGVVARLLADDDRQVRDMAAVSMHEADLSDPSWLDDALLAVSSTGSPFATFAFADELHENAWGERRDLVNAKVDQLLETDPDHGNTLRLGFYYYRR